MKIFLAVIFSLFFCYSASGQGLDETYHYAARMQQTKQYEQAILAYQRVLFFDQSVQYNDRIYQHIGQCYLETDDFANAANYFDLAYFSARTDSVKTDLLFKKAFCMILNGNYKHAQIELLNLPDSLSNENQKRLSIYYGVLHYGLGDFKEAENNFKAGVEQKSTQDSIALLFKKVDRANKISPKTARLLSTVLPGLGQIYNGDIKNGLNSLLLLGGFSVIAYNTAINYSALDAGISILPWFQRYYMGGYGKAEEIALKRKELKISHLKNEILYTIANSKQ